MTLDLTLVLVHGAALAAAFCVVVLLILRVNPRLFLKHFPASVQDSQPPLLSSEKVVGYLLGAPLLAIILGGPILAGLAFQAATGAQGLSVFVHALAVGMIANLADWLLVDELILGVMRPRWAAPPGVDIRALPFEHGHHFADFAKGTIVFLVPAIVAALVL